jgi:hypothetical protein
MAEKLKKLLYKTNKERKRIMAIVVKVKDLVNVEEVQQEVKNERAEKYKARLKEYVKEVNSAERVLSIARKALEEFLEREID